MKERLKVAIKIGAITTVALGAGYLGAEINRASRASEMAESVVASNELILPGYKGADRWALDIWDRYSLTNDRINKLALVNDIVDKDQDRRIRELQEHTGIHRPVPTPRPRPTVSQRLKPALTMTPR